MNGGAPSPRPEIALLVEDQHGGPDHKELAALGLAPAGVLDFSASTNAFGPLPEVLEAVAGCDAGRYPDRCGEPLRGALAAHEGVPTEQLVLGNGAAQLIWSIALAYLRPGDPCLVLGPSFGEYRVASHIMGANVTEVRARAEEGFQLAQDELERAVEACRPRVAWLCNPNNPTGVFLDKKRVEALINVSPSTLWVIDEAYRPFVGAQWSGVPLLERGNVLLLRSLTKDCNLPGLRIGYALAGSDVVEAVRRATPPWSAGAAAIAAGLAAIASRDRCLASSSELRVEAGWLAGSLRSQGWRVLPSATHFFLLHTAGRQWLRSRLLREHAIQVRDCASFGLPEHIRIAARTRADNERLLCAMEAMR